MEQEQIENSSIGETIKIRRQEKGMTQLELSNATGISLTSLKKYEQGSRMPKLDALIKLNDVLDLSQEIQLFAKTPRPEKEKETELPKIKEMLTGKNFNLLPHEEIDDLIKEIDEELDSYCRATTGTEATSSVINSEKELTHKIFDDIMVPYEEQPIFDIVKVLTGYLELNYEGKKLVLDLLKTLCGAQSLIQKNYDPSDKRPLDCRRSYQVQRQYIGLD